jgi:hypothetical protein
VPLIGQLSNPQFGHSLATLFARPGSLNAARDVIRSYAYATGSQLSEAAISLRAGRSVMTAVGGRPRLTPYPSIGAISAQVATAQIDRSALDQIMTACLRLGGSAQHLGQYLRWSAEVERLLRPAVEFCGDQIEVRQTQRAGEEEGPCRLSDSTTHPPSPPGPAAAIFTDHDIALVLDTVRVLNDLDGLRSDEMTGLFCAMQYGTSASSSKTYHCKLGGGAEDSDAPSLRPLD